MYIHIYIYDRYTCMYPEWELRCSRIGAHFCIYPAGWLAELGEPGGPARPAGRPSETAMARPAALGRPGRPGLV